MIYYIQFDLKEEQKTKPIQLDYVDIFPIFFIPLTHHITFTSIILFFLLPYFCAIYFLTDFTILPTMRFKFSLVSKKKFIIFTISCFQNCQLILASYPNQITIINEPFLYIFLYFLTIYILNTMTLTFLFPFLVCVAYAELKYINTTVCTKFNSGYQYTFIQTEGQSLVTLEINQNNYSQVLSYETTSQSKIQYEYSIQTGYYPQLKLAPSSLYYNGSFLSYDEKRLYVHSGFNSSLIRRIDPGLLSYQILSDVCYGDSLNQIFVLVLLRNNYCFYIYNNSQTSYTKKNISISSSLQLDKMLCKNNKIFILFQSKLMVYSMDSSITLITSFTYSSAPTSLMDMKVGNELLAFSVYNSLKIYNYTVLPFLLVNHANFSMNITGLQIQSPYFVIVSSTTMILQYDFEINQIISRTRLQTTYNQLVYKLGNNILIVVKDLMISPYVDPYIYYYSWNSSYQCNSCTCMITYRLNLSTNQCVKDYDRNLSNYTILNITNNSNNIYFGDANTTLNESLGQQMLPSKYENARQGPIHEIQQSLINTFKQLHQSKLESKSLTKAISFVLIVSSFKLSPQFLLSLLVVFDDLWYYQYHLKQYPVCVQFLFEECDIIQRDRLDPWFLQAIDFLNTESNYAVRTNAQLVSYLNISTLQGENIFFTRSFLENYRNNVLLTISLYIFFKLIELILFLLQAWWSKNQIIHGLYKTVNKSAQLWVFISSLIQANLSKVAFDFGIQAQAASFTEHIAKFNIMVCFIVFFVVCFYSTAFYPILFCIKTKKCAKKIIMPLKYCTLSYFHQPALILLKSLIRCFIHSFFLSNYIVQIFLLFLVDAILAIYCIIIRRFFHNACIYFVYLFYFIFFTAFDLFFYFQSACTLEQFNVYISYVRELVSIINISGIILTFLITILIVFVVTIVKKFKLFIKNRAKVKFIFQYQKKNDSGIQNTNMVQKSRFDLNTVVKFYNKSKKQLKNQQILEVIDNFKSLRKSGKITNKYGLKTKIKTKIKAKINNSGMVQPTKNNSVGEFEIMEQKLMKCNKLKKFNKLQIIPTKIVKKERSVM